MRRPHDTTGLLHTIGRLRLNETRQQLHVLSDEEPIAAQTFERPQDMGRMAYDRADVRKSGAAFRETRAPGFADRQEGSC